MAAELFNVTRPCPLGKMSVSLAVKSLACRTTGNMKNMPTRRDLVCFALLASFGVPGAGAEAGARIPGWGTLTFPLPEGWRVLASTTDSASPLTLGPSNGRAFEVRVIPLTSPQTSIPPSTPESLSGQANANAKRRARDALEPALSVRQFRAGDSFGYYYSFTDKAPKPGDFRHYTEGLAQIAGYPITFVVISEQASAELLTQVLNFLQRGRRV